MRCVYFTQGNQMATNLALDDSLILQVQKIGGFKTKKEAVTTALKDYVKKMNQVKIIRNFGKIDFHKDYDYKKSRNRS